MTDINDSPQTTPSPLNAPPVTDEINLLDYWPGLWKRRRMISAITVVIVLLTAIVSLFMTNIYQAKAVIMPIASKDSSGSSLGLAALASQLGGLPGISLPSSATVAEISSLLKSNILREKMVEQYNLLPVLFYKKWDEGKKTWKKRDSSGFSLNPLRLVSMLTKNITTSSIKKPRKKDPEIPDMDDALRSLNKIIKINREIKENTITITVDFHDPEMSAKILEYYLTSLTDYMSSEAKRVANINRKYLEEQLANTADPFIRQKTYNLIAQQIETAMMAEVKENFAFKVIDPPRVPDNKIKPKRAQMVILSFVVSLFIGIFMALILEYIQNAKARKEISKPIYHHSP